jgi:hypothetical protein
MQTTLTEGSNGIDSKLLVSSAASTSSSSGSGQCRHSEEENHISRNEMKNEIQVRRIRIQPNPLKSHAPKQCCRSFMAGSPFTLTSCTSSARRPSTARPPTRTATTWRQLHLFQAVSRRRVRVAAERTMNAIIDDQSFAELMEMQKVLHTRALTHERAHKHTRARVRARRISTHLVARISATL